ncbi:hypothetical protein P775_01910 [Puniceibacterium antarcticum]|uniref:Uncharacterized protein n=1 Tax=Puniceibacterium antarcticum TaxID=1206336 RepID=A0A2G8RK71_9RHOB|nr:hypothetical protein P775_01910 [Puniceibacterium antarcticum]
MLWPHSTAQIASPVVPFKGQTNAFLIHRYCARAGSEAKVRNAVGAAALFSIAGMELFI